MKQVVGSAIIVDPWGWILVGRRVGSSKYCPPGGKIEEGESLQAGLAREVKEEVNLTVQPGDMELLGFCDLPGKVIFFYMAFRWHGILKNMEPEKHYDWDWHEEIPDDGVEGLRYFNRVLRESMQTRIRECI